MGKRNNHRKQMALRCAEQHRRWCDKEAERARQEKQASHTHQSNQEEGGK